MESAKENLKLKDKVQKQRHKKNIGKRFYYSFLTFVLLVCLLQIGFSTILNISKTISYKSKMKKMEELLAEAHSKNTRLKEELRGFNTIKSAETIARNNLKLAAENEVLVIINQNQPDEHEKNKETGFLNTLLQKKMMINIKKG